MADFDQLLKMDPNHQEARFDRARVYKQCADMLLRFPDGEEEGMEYLSKAVTDLDQLLKRSNLVPARLLRAKIRIAVRIKVLTPRRTTRPDIRFLSRFTRRPSDTDRGCLRVPR